MGYPTDLGIADGAGEADRLPGLLRQEPGKDVDGHICFGQVFAVQAAVAQDVRAVVIPRHRRAGAGMEFAKAHFAGKNE